MQLGTWDASSSERVSRQKLPHRCRMYAWTPCPCPSIHARLHSLKNCLHPPSRPTFWGIDCFKNSCTVPPQRQGHVRTRQQVKKPIRPRDVRVCTIDSCQLWITSFLFCTLPPLMVGFVDPRASRPQVISLYVQIEVTFSETSFGGCECLLASAPCLADHGPECPR